MTKEYTPGPLYEASQKTKTALWNDSSDLHELSESIKMGGVGATCNPSIALNTLKAHPDVWGPHIKKLAEQMPTATENEIGWKTVEDMSVEAAKLLEPAFEESNGKNGRLSVQTTPANYRNAEKLVEQAVHFSEMAPNIIVKIPATAVGIEALEEATYRGVVCNVTVSFTVPQAVSAGEAIERGLKRREEEGKDISKMWPVVTLMVGRLDDWIKIVAERERLVIDPGHLEWAGIAAIKRAAVEFEKRGLRSRMLAAAFRNVNHYLELVGGDLVVSPPFKWQKRINDGGADMVERWDAPVPENIMKTLLSIDEFRRAYEPDGMKPDEFLTFGATVRTLRGVLADNANLDAFVRDIILPQP